ncbi:conserved protein of unknown function [Candidatus Hydrogenisulfobacillus filiaventi]|uniref:Uncharacterized protein n=1 Tax=Candidatus Hydrogenisulfobacillus filiaventi TaxID=2707344 RepID=A0A6F8ZII9_9FIRM|nr:conserved protein of unknown function [Candidatus Hydrogenisulfobacillus filiaventi]
MCPGLAEALRGAKVVRSDKERGVFVAWFGGHGIHAYDADGREVAFWNLAAAEEPSEAAVLADIDETVRTGRYPWADGQWWARFPGSES